MASTIADPAGDGSGTRSALVPESRGLLQLLARPPPHDSHTQARAWIRTHRGWSSMSVPLRAYKPASVGAPLPARTSADSRVEDRGHEEGTGPVPDVNACRLRCAGGGRHASTLVPWCPSPPLHPLALPSPQLGTPLHHLSLKLGLSLASSPAAPRSLRGRCDPSISCKLRGNGSIAKKEALGRREELGGPRACGGLLSLRGASLHP